MRAMEKEESRDDAAEMYVLQVVVREAQWLNWNVRWGTITPPQKQKWYTHAEHPSGSSSFMRTLAPCIRR